MSESPPKLPPMWIIDIAKRVHQTMTAAQRRMAPPSAVLMEIMSGMWRPYALGVVAELGVADRLAAGPRDVAELARDVDAHEESLYRVMRALAHDGIFAQPTPRRFGLTALSEPLRSDHPRSVRSSVRRTMAPWTLATWAGLGDAVRTGEAQFDALYGKDFWAFLDENPDDAACFHGSMAEMTSMIAPMVAAVYDFGKHRTLVDVGGGRAIMLSRLLAMNPGLRGINFDLATAVEKAPAVLAEAGVASRCEIVTGSFMDSVPAGHDAYLLKHIVHGLDDAAIDVLFGNLRAAVQPGATLILIEMLVPEGSSGTHPSYLDLQMLIGSGGRERTRAEYAALMGRHGFTLQATHRTPSPVTVIVGAAQ